MLNENHIVKAFEALGGQIDSLQFDLYANKITIESKDAEIAALKKRIAELEGKKEEENND